MTVSAMSTSIESLLWNELNKLQTLYQQANENSLAHKERRKELVRNTKQFKDLTDDEKLSQFPGLLKQYQNELDQLTKENVKVASTVNEIVSLLEKTIDPSELSLDNPYLI